MEAVREGGAAREEAIKRRRLNLAVVEGIDGSKTLVIGDDHQKIGPFARRSHLGGIQPSRGQQHGRRQAAHGFQKGPPVSYRTGRCFVIHNSATRQESVDGMRGKSRGRMAQPLSAFDPANVSYSRQDDLPSRRGGKQHLILALTSGRQPLPFREMAVRRVRLSVRTRPSQG